jgi:hypothetical protein
MNIGEIREYLGNFPDDLEVKFVKHSSLKPLSFWDCHEWFVNEKKYIKGPKDEKFLAILVEDDQ